VKKAAHVSSIHANTHLKNMWLRFSGVLQNVFNTPRSTSNVAGPEIIYFCVAEAYGNEIKQ